MEHGLESTLTTTQNKLRAYRIEVSDKRVQTLGWLPSKVAESIVRVALYNLLRREGPRSVERADNALARVELNKVAHSEYPLSTEEQRAHNILCIICNSLRCKVRIE